MFVRVKKRSNGNLSVQICESYRRADKVSQKIIRHVGQAANDREVAIFKKLANSIIIEMKSARAPVLPIFSPEKFYDLELKRKKPAKNKVNLAGFREEQRIIMGIGDIFGKLYRDLSFDTIIKGTRRNKQWNSLLKTCVLARIANPASKRETASFLERDYGIKAPLEKIYRLMDHVSDCEDDIKQIIASRTLSLFDNKLDILFFDVTTLYFESTKQDELRDFGFSKDCKFKDVQVVLSLITTRHGLPVGYELFPGNTFEGNTLIETLKKTKALYGVDDISIVADRGVFSEKNLKALEEEGMKYVVGAKLKKMDKKTRGEIFEESDVSPCVVSDELHWAKELEYKGRRLVVSYSSKRARKDMKDRMRLVDRLLKKANDGEIKIKDLIPNYGTKKYIKVNNEDIDIDFDKISKDAEWDGIHGIISNSQNRSHVELMQSYRGLWVIEESFRVNKHDLKMRPIFHWKPERVRAHVAICFLAYALSQQAVYRIRTQSDIKLSLRQLRNELLHAQSSLLVDTEEGKRYLLPSKSTVNQKKIYRTFGLVRNETPEEYIPNTTAP